MGTRNTKKLIGRYCRLTTPTAFGWAGVGTIKTATLVDGDVLLSVFRHDTGEDVTCMRSDVSVIRRGSVAADALALRITEPVQTQILGNVAAGKKVAT